MESLNCEDLGTRAVNQRLRSLPDGGHARLLQPRGRHNPCRRSVRPAVDRDRGKCGGTFVGRARR